MKLLLGPLHAGRGLKYRPYKCDNCPRSYTLLGSLKRHRKIECGKEKQFACSYCSLKFYYKHELQCHTFTKHKRL
ncbi:hypothetical protein ILUMI_19723, partial [Ignelater luminosus]